MTEEINNIFKNNLYAGIAEQLDLLLKIINKACNNVLSKINKDIEHCESNLFFKQGYMCAKINICDLIEQMKKIFEEQKTELKNEKTNESNRQSN